MKMNLKSTISAWLLSLGVGGLTTPAIAQQAEFVVDAQQVGAPIQSTMYGIFFEDINFGADGGLYAELIKNRSFEFEHPWTG